MNSVFSLIINDCRNIGPLVYVDQRVHAMWNMMLITFLFLKISIKPKI